MVTSLQVSWSKFCIYFSSPPCMLHTPPILFSLISLFWQYPVKRTSYETPHYAVFSNVLLFHDEVFWVVTQCSVVGYQRFRGPRYLHLQGEIFHPHPEYRDSMDLWNVETSPPWNPQSFQILPFFQVHIFSQHPPLKIPSVYAVPLVWETKFHTHTKQTEIWRYIGL